VNATVTQTSDLILRDSADGILTLTINRPAARNAFDRPTAEALEEALDAFEEARDLSVAVITGAGHVFCAGQDLKAAARGEPAISKRRGGFGIMTVPPSKPIIAAVEGPALAGGFELALCCDLIVASRESTFGLPEVKRSLVAVGGALFRLPARIPHHVAMEMILSGNPQSAERMRELGLVNRVAEPGKALDVALELARALVENGPLALRASKEIASRAAREQWTEAQAWSRQMDFAGPVFASEDFREGLAAFAQKRKPVWKGR
jgi:enoyl-CoA hydratase